MKCGFQLLFAACLCLTSFRSIAMAFNYVSVSCGQQHVVIESDYAEGTPSDYASFYLENYGQANECRLKSGDIVKIRFGTEFDYHVSQQSWVSVWFDGMKWLSRTSVEVTGSSDVRADSIDISANGVKLCSLRGPLIIALDETDKKQKPLCKFIRRRQLTNVVDDKEPAKLDTSAYPLVPPTILLGQNSSLCKAMAALDQNTWKSGVELGGHLWLNLPVDERIQFSGPITPGAEWIVRNGIDLDNGDAGRHAYHRSQLMGYGENYDIYVVLDDAGYRRFMHTAGSDQDLLKNAEAVWPADWSGHPDRLEARKNMGSLVISLSISQDSTKKIDIPDDQVRIMPFSYRDQTYLLLSNNAGSNLGFVIKPHPAGKFDQECVFRAGLTNF